jgi:putative transposon-encoded protein
MVWMAFHFREACANWLTNAAFDGHHHDRRIQGLRGEIRENVIKLEIYGKQMIEKRVTSSGNSGRVYLPPDWVGVM